MLKVAMVTIIDRAAGGVYTDVSGPILPEIIREMGAEVTAAPIVPDDSEQIQALLHRLADEEDIHLILTTGGTGPAPRDHTPEATKAVIAVRTTLFAVIFAAISDGYGHLVRRNLDVKAVLWIGGGGILEIVLTFCTWPSNSSRPTLGL